MLRELFPRRTKLAKMCGCPNFFGLFPSWISFCYELFLSHILIFLPKKTLRLREFFPCRTKSAKMCGYPIFFGFFSLLNKFCYELFLSNILNFCQNNAEVARVFPEQPNRQKCADLADNSASRSHVSTSLFFSPTRLTHHFPLSISNLKLRRQYSNTNATCVIHIVYGGSRETSTSWYVDCGAKTRTCRYVELTKHHFLRHFLPEHVHRPRITR